MNNQATAVKHSAPAARLPSTETEYQPILNRTQLAQLNKAGLKGVVERITSTAKFLDVFETETNKDSVYSDSHKKKMVAKQVAKDLGLLAGQLGKEYLGGAVDAYERANRKVNQELELKGGIDATILTNASVLIAQEKFSVGQLVQMGDANLLRAALLLPVTRYQLLKGDNDGQKEQLLSTAVAKVTLGEKYEAHERLGQRINIMREVVASLNGVAVAQAGIATAALQ